MNIIIEKAQESDIDALSQFYDEVNDYLASHINYPEWKRGIYPARDTAENAVLEGTAYAARENGRIIGSLSCARCRKMVMKRRTGIFLPIMTILSLSIRWRCTRIIPERAWEGSWWISSSIMGGKMA